MRCITEVGPERAVHAVDPTRIFRPIRFRSVATTRAIRPGTTALRDVHVDFERNREPIQHSIDLPKMLRSQTASEIRFFVEKMR
jgi:hypothetical protein